MTLPARAPSATLDGLAEKVSATGGAPTAPNPLEWALLVVTLFALGRSPVLFLRLRLQDEVGGPVGLIWQNDALVGSALLFPTLAVCALAVRRGDLREMSRHLVLVGLLALAVASTEWSVEPSVTQLRALMFATTAGVGWYLGARFTLPQQLDVVIGAGTIGVASSVMALFLWPEVAKSTNGVVGEWSGVYVNRNLLALAVCITLLAVLVRLPSARSWHRAALIVLVVPACWLLWRCGARTGPVALVAAVAVISLAAVIRLLLVQRGAPAKMNAAVMLGGSVGGLLLANRVQGALLEWLGREPTLTRRTEMWDIDRALLEVRPWRGWGFEAIWSHQPAIDYAAPRFHAYPYQAHNGYFEMALSLGRVGLFLLLGLIVITFVRCVALAWEVPTAAALWPLAIATYAVVANVSESLFIANEAHWALFVSAGVAAMVARRPEVPQHLRPSGQDASIGVAVPTEQLLRR